MKSENGMWDIPTNFNVKDFQWVDKSGQSPGNCVLGQGSYGQVKLCRNQKNKLFACKILEKKRVAKLKMETYIKQEIDIHLRMKHPHILKLHGCAQDDQHIYLFLDYCKNNCVYFYLKKKKKLRENAAFTFFFQTGLGGARL